MVRSKFCLENKSEKQFKGRFKKNKHVEIPYSPDSKISKLIKSKTEILSYQSEAEFKEFEPWFTLSVPLKSVINVSRFKPALN